MNQKTYFPSVLLFFCSFVFVFFLSSSSFLSICQHQLSYFPVGMAKQKKFLGFIFFPFCFNLIKTTTTQSKHSLLCPMSDVNHLQQMWQSAPN